MERFRWCQGQDNAEAPTKGLVAPVTAPEMLDIARRKFPKIVNRIELAAPIVLDNP